MNGAGVVEGTVDGLQHWQGGSPVSLDAITMQFDVQPHTKRVGESCSSKLNQEDVLVH